MKASLSLTLTLSSLLAGVTARIVPKQLVVPTFRTCGNEATEAGLALAAEMQDNELSGRMGATILDEQITIPTVFHVVYRNNSDTDTPSDSDLQAQLKVMNDDYANMGFSFNLINTTRTESSTWANWTDKDQVNRPMRQALKQGGKGTLNVYFVSSLTINGRNTVYGLCDNIVNSPQLEELLDGCVIKSSAMIGPKSVAPVNLGKTVVHEVGHWLGLQHVFGKTENGCNGPGDYISDTAAQRGPTVGCPAQADTCPEQPGLDNIHNFMDYSDDLCMVEFTTGQKLRMHNAWNTVRAGGLS